MPHSPNRRGMDELALRAVVDARIADAVGWLDSDIAAERRENLDFYRGEPFGNEVEGRSQVISRDVMDTVEWMMPALLEIFHGSDRPVDFEPVGREDEGFAKQATDYCNHIYQKDNPGFVITYNWVKDALIQKLGIVKHWWQESDETRDSRLEGLTDDELALLATDDSVEIRSQQARNIEGPTGEPVTLYDVDLRRTERRGRIRIEPVPPEEYLVERRAKPYEEPDFEAHCHRISRSDLIAQGYDPALVNDLPADEEDYDEEGRYDHEDGGAGPAHSDDAMRQVRVHECLIRVDYDGDGIAERRLVVVAGGASPRVILKNEPFDDRLFSRWSPIMMPHTIWGMSVVDAVKDLQLIKSTIWRQMLDGLYLANNPRMAVVEGQVNLDDLLTSRPGGIIRTRSLDAMREVTLPWVGGQAFPMLDYVDRQREQRTGVSEAQSGLNPNVLQNQTATAVNQAMTAAQARIRLIARVFAETGMRQLFRAILRMVVKYQDRQRMIRLSDDWVPMDPRAWNAEMDVTCNVGLGTGNKDQQLAHLSTILGYQKEALAAGGLGMVTPAHLYNTVAEMTRLVGLPGIERFFSDPRVAQPPPTQPPPDPQATQTEAWLRVEAAKAEADREQAAIDAALKREELAQKERLALAEMEQERLLKAEELATQATLRREEMTLRYGGPD